MMDFTGLTPLAEKPINGLSKGMKQRLCLGRAMLHDPAVLVLDEPAAGLDPRARIELREMIRRLADQGKTVLISSHILTELAEMCDQVGIIEQGRLVAVGSVEEIEANQQRNVHVRVLSDPAPLVAWLEARDDVHAIRREGNLIQFVHDGNLDSEAEILRQMVLADHRIIEFGSKKKSLEDVFMQLTAGNVQ